MNDLELKEYLLQTCPVLPGQEARAWLTLQERLASGPARSTVSFPFWRSLAYGGLALLLTAMVFDLGMSMRPQHHALAFADSQVPGIYATSFYSHAAQAQVVWLNGMDPATDKPTYLDPTSVIKASASDPYSAKSPDRL